MTPEKAAYYRLMLMAGLEEQYDRELDEILDREDTIRPPVLDLACCMSDRNQTISILSAYIGDNTPDYQQVYVMVMEELRRLYSDHFLTLEETIAVMYIISQNYELGTSKPWEDLRWFDYDFDLVDSQLLSEDVYREVFEAWLFRGERLDPWKMDKSYQTKKKPTLLDFLRKAFRKETSL